jgi:cation transport ATPase
MATTNENYFCELGALEQSNTHPLAQAIVAEAIKRDIQLPVAGRLVPMCN